MTRDEFSARQLMALIAASLSAPLAVTCSGVGWQWALAAAALAGCLYLYIVYGARRVPKGMGYAGMLRRAYGTWPGRALSGLYWAWIALTAARAAGMAALSFPDERAFPLIPLALLAIAALVAKKSVATVCRFGGVLYLFVAALLAFTLIFGAAEIELENLRPAGAPAELTAPLSVLVLPTAALFLLDRKDATEAKCGRWYLLIAALTVALSVICTGSLGHTLARRAENPFWLMSRSISVLGVMERFEALISALLSLGFCCLLSLLLLAGRKAFRGAAPQMGSPAAVWITAAFAAGLTWASPWLPTQFCLTGELIFWVLIPVLTLGIVSGRFFKKVEKKG